MKADESVPKSRPTVLLLRGTSVNEWDMRPFAALRDHYELRVLTPKTNDFGVHRIDGVDVVEVHTRHERVGKYARRLPARFQHLVDPVIGPDGYRRFGPHAAQSAIVHAAEIDTWFSEQAASAKHAGAHFKLVLSVWQTIPALQSGRTATQVKARESILSATDLFLPVTERAATALELEGVPRRRMLVTLPGADTALFAPATRARPRADGRHLLLSVGRLVWDKGHQDLLRAAAVLHRRGLRPVVGIIGQGPEEQRLRDLASDLGIGEHTSFVGHVPHGELPSWFAEASCLVLASLPTRAWEEQFGFVLAEALAAHLAVVAADSGAISEVMQDSAVLFAAGDWIGLADALAAGPLKQAPAARCRPDDAALERLSAGAATQRLLSAYKSVLGAHDR